MHEITKFYQKVEFIKNCFNVTGRETALESCTFDYEYEGSEIVYKDVESQ